MSNQTDGALRVLQWLGNMEARVSNLSNTEDGRQVPGKVPVRPCNRDFNKEWEQKVAHRKEAANKRLVKAIRAIPASNNRERMTLFLNYGLKGAVHRQLEKFVASSGLPVMPWVDMDLLGALSEKQADWHGGGNRCLRVRHAARSTLRMPAWGAVQRGRGGGAEVGLSALHALGHGQCNSAISS
ncbi:MAG: hypothetical protein NVV67_13345 [Pseudoxanthomonas sp.]|nr:hypothetical protein [Pseudoxanthomonas sp.]